MYTDKNAFIFDCEESAFLTYSWETLVAKIPRFVLDQADNPDPCVRLRLATVIPRLAPWYQGLHSFKLALDLL